MPWRSEGIYCENRFYAHFQSRRRQKKHRKRPQSHGNLHIFQLSEASEIKWMDKTERFLQKKKSDGKKSKGKENYPTKNELLELCMSNIFGC